MLWRLLGGIAPVTGIAAAACLVALWPPQPPAPELPSPVRQFDDMTGQPVLLSGTPQSVMVFPPVLWHYLTVDGEEGHISAIASYLKDEADSTLLGTVFPGLLNTDVAATRVGAVPLGVEQILLEQPDLVLSWSWLADELAQIRYPGLVWMEGDDTAGMETTYRLFGSLSGRSEAADTLLARHVRAMDELGRSVSPSPQPIKVAVMPNSEFVLRIKGADILQTLGWLGARDVGADLPSRNSPINVETLFVFDPDFIFLPSYIGNTRLAPADLYADPRLEAISAIRQRRVYRMPGGVARMDGPVEAPLLAQWMVELINPEARLRQPLRTAIREAYRTAFDYEASDDAIDGMLRIDDNRASAGYLRFARDGAPDVPAPDIPPT